MSKRPGGKSREKAVALYHDMRVEEDFATCAQRIFKIIRHSQETTPNKPRYLYLDIQGHKNSAGGFDKDAFEIMNDFLLAFMAPFLTEISCPLYHATNPREQRNDLPGELHIECPDESHDYDHNALSTRAREDDADARRTRPRLRAIADYLGLEEPGCIICWDPSVERAHVVPEALGGSNDVRNFALLCKRHHAEAPAIADAEAFWAWIDYKCERNGHEKWQRVDPELLKSVGLGDVLGRSKSPTAPEKHFAKVRDELINLYGWDDCDFVELHSWGELMEEFHEVMKLATSSHSGVTVKPSTEAWAFDTARRRLAGTLPRGSAQAFLEHTGEQDDQGSRSSRRDQAPG